MSDERRQPLTDFVTEAKKFFCPAHKDGQHVYDEMGCCYGCSADKTTARLYFECHITLDPVPERERNGTDILLRPFGFKLAKLFMEKGVPSTHDTFATAHDTDLDTLKTRCAEAIRCLRKYGYTVRRYKIEDTLLDSRHDGDPLGVFEAPEGYELVRKAY